MTDVLEVIQKIEEAAKKPNKDKRIWNGQDTIGHQGDVYFHVVPLNHPHSKLMAKGECQIALGTGNGARHVAKGHIEVFEGTTLPEGVSAPMGVEVKEVCGPLIIGRDVWAVEHPEHAHHQFLPGAIQVTYQYDPRTMRRVID